MLRVQSRVTNTPVELLRQEFIVAFTSAPTVSEGRTKSLEQAITTDKTQPVTPARAAAPSKRSANMVDVARFAKANNMSVDDAVAKLEADGVDVVGN